MLAGVTAAYRGLSEAALRELGAGGVREAPRHGRSTRRRARWCARTASAATRSRSSRRRALPGGAAGRALGIEHVLCTRLEVEDGVFTGARGEARPAGGRASCTTPRELAEREDLDLARATSTPTAPTTSRCSRSWATRGRSIPTVAARGHRARARLADPPLHEPRAARASRRSRAPRSPTASLIPTRAGGRGRRLREPLAARGRERAGARRWPELATALAGIDLDVTGEEHLWSHRPAVFIFNHQSGVDTLLVVKLLRRDVTGVAKQEIRATRSSGRSSRSRASCSSTAATRRRRSRRWSPRSRR